MDDKKSIKPGIYEWSWQGKPQKKYTGFVLKSDTYTFFDDSVVRVKFYNLDYIKSETFGWITTNPLFLDISVLSFIREFTKEDKMKISEFLCLLEKK